MIRNHIIPYHIILLLLPITSLAAIYDPILEQTKPGTITIIGETHKKPESVELFQNLALDVIRHYQCVVIGLEIGSDQQTILEAVMQGRASVKEIALWPPLDHPPYRRMIETFAELNPSSPIKFIILYKSIGYYFVMALQIKFITKKVLTSWNSHGIIII
jgi:hypothetical protein